MRRCLLAIAACAVALPWLATPARAGVLPIPPVVQNTHVWCWVAVGEMIFRYLGMPNINQAGIYQCGVIGALAAAQFGLAHPCNVNCANCVVPAGSAEWVVAMLESYPMVVQAFAGSARQIDATHERWTLSPETVAAEIDQGLPFIAGITPYGLPSGVSAHVALVVGYERDGAGGLWLKVNDPYPFNYTGHNPYVAAGAREDSGGGSYWIPYDTFVSGLHWAETFRISVR